MRPRAMSRSALHALMAVTPLIGLVCVGEPAGAASRCGDRDRPAVTDLLVRQAKTLPEPAVRVPFRDPVFGSCMVRLTDRKADFLGNRQKGFKNEYSRVQAFNADETAILIRGVDATWYLYDATSLRPIRKLAFSGAVDPRWDAADPKALYFIDGTRLLAYDVRSDEQRLVRDFAGDFPGQRLSAAWTRYEGSPSLDGRTWGLMAEDADWVPVAFLVYDQVADRIVALRDMRGTPGIRDDVDHVTISPLGGYFIAAFDRVCERGVPGSDASPCGLMVYDRMLGGGRSLGRGIGHHDLALDARGREVIVFQDTDRDEIAMIDLGTGERTSLWTIDFSHSAIGFHLSGRAHRRPGWALVSTHDDSPVSRTWMDNQVFAIELRAKGRIARFAHTRSIISPKMEQDYWAEPHATVNRDFTRVLFTTNWGRSGTEEVETMLIDLAPDWPELRQ